SQGQIIATIVNFFCIPLKNLGAGLASVGISMVCTIVNMIVPSASAKAAILCPIIKPMCENLGITLQMGVQALGYGDKLTNIISPVLGTTVAALGLANIPYDKWFKWVFPKIAYIAVICWASLYVLSMLGFA
ncbi:MAG: AbgT family transporter, partial [Solobacterium sp.]|nr:AbgT family transporter [Solobacterium sp.]